MALIHVLHFKFPVLVFELLACLRYVAELIQREARNRVETVLRREGMKTQPVEGIVKDMKIVA